MPKFNTTDGIPSVSNYKKLTDSDNFKKIENFSDSFIKNVGDEISSYNRRWVKDPLHQWSRQWEYPYVIQRISDHKKSNKKYRVLDLGSGVTFMPYYLVKQLNVPEIIALDYDSSLASLFELVNEREGVSIEFVHKDMRDLSRLNKGSFDAIYSVSVLEHTNDYERIIKDSYKLLKPGGIFVLTFDISLDGMDDIPLSKAEHLINTLEKTYNTQLNVKLSKIKVDSKIITSRKIIKLDQTLSPWKYPVVNAIKPLLKHGKLGSLYKNLTVCCVSLIKR